MKKIIFALFVSCLFVRAAAADSTVVVDWKESPVGAAPSIGNNRIAFLEYMEGGASVEVVDADSTVPNPFPQDQRALLINQANERRRPAIPVFDFYSGQPLAKGSFTMKAMVIPPSEPASLSGLNIILAPEASPEMAKGSLESGLARIRLTGDFSIQILVPAADNKPIECDPRITSSTPYEVRIDWDLTASPPFFTVHINGVGVSNREEGRKGLATQFPFTDLSATGIGAIMLMPRTTDSSYIIGRMEMGEFLP